MCEKPFTLSVQEAEALLEAASRTGRQVQLGTNMRYMPESRYLRNIVASGDCRKSGRVQNVGMSFLPRFGVPITVAGLPVAGYSLQLLCRLWIFPCGRAGIPIR